MNNKNTLQTICIFATFIFFFALLIGMLYPFSTVILWTALLYLLIRPLYIKCETKLNKTKKTYGIKRHAIAGGFSIGTLLLIIGPLTVICILLVQQGISFLDSAEKFISQNQNFAKEGELLQKVANFLSSFGIELPDPNTAEIKKNVLSFIQSYSSKFISAGTAVVSKTGSFIVSILFVVFSLYFCFLDGPYLSSLVKKAVPIDPEYMNVLTKKFSEIVKNLFAGYILVALYQGLASFIIMTCFQVKGSLLFSVILMFASFIPMFGAAIVWVPVGIAICVTKSVVKGIIFLILSGFCISFLDNFIRPLFLKDRINVHPLVIFFSILGGIKLFGINGLILGPLTVILFFTVLDLIISKKSSQE